MKDQTWICPKGHIVRTPIPAISVACGKCQKPPKGDHYNPVMMKLTKAA